MVPRKPLASPIIFTCITTTEAACIEVSYADGCPLLLFFCRVGVYRDLRTTKQKNRHQPLKYIYSFAHRRTLFGSLYPNPTTATALLRRACV